MGSFYFLRRALPLTVTTLRSWKWFHRCEAAVSYLLHPHPQPHPHPETLYPGIRSFPMIQRTVSVTVNLSSPRGSVSGVSICFQEIFLSGDNCVSDNFPLCVAGHLLAFYYTPGSQVWVPTVQQSHQLSGMDPIALSQLTMSQTDV